MATGSDTKSFFGRASPNEVQQVDLEESHEDHENSTPPDKTGGGIDKEMSRLVYNKSDLSLKRLVPAEDKRINLPSYQHISYITSKLHCDEKDLKMHRSDELTVGIPTAKFGNSHPWQGKIAVDVMDHRKAVSIQISVLPSLDTPDGPTAALHVETKVTNRELLSRLDRESKSCAVVLVSKVYDRQAGKQIDLMECDIHIMKDGRVNFIQYMVLDENIKSCISGKVSLEMLVRFYIYPREEE